MTRGEQSIVRAIRGPITLITIGVLFALNNFTPYGFDKTWPVLLIVFGLLSLLRRGLDPVAPIPPVPPAASPYPYPPSAPGGYAGSSYTAPPQQPAGPAKGGFGSSAAPKQGDPGQGTGGPVGPGPGESI